MGDEKIVLGIEEARAYIEKLVKKIFSQEVSNIEYKSVSKSNNVYRVQTKNMGNLIVRINQDRERKDVFMKEEWCCRTARQYGIPAPNILTSGNIIIPYSYSISEEMKGTNAEIYQGSKLKIWKQLGKYAKRINSIDTRGYGIYFNWKSYHPMGFETWKEYLYGYDIRIDRVLSLYEQHLGRKLPKLEKQIEKIKNWKVFPKLTHFDLVPTNVLVDSDGKITSILDWEYARSLPAPHGELSQIYTWLTAERKEKELKAFIEGYGFLPGEFEEVKEEIEAYALIRQANHLFWLQRTEGKEPEVMKFIESAAIYSTLAA